MVDLAHYPPAFAIRDEPSYSPRACIVAVDGEADALAAPALRDRLERAARKGAPGVVIDLKGVTFMDSFALGALLAGQRAMRAAGGDVALVFSRQGQPGVVRLLEATKMDLRLPGYETRERALGALGARRTARRAA